MFFFLFNIFIVVVCVFFESTYDFCIILFYMFELILFFDSSGILGVADPIESYQKEVPRRELLLTSSVVKLYLLFLGWFSHSK